MITCTKCGGKNSDDALACARCGNKLQSSRRSSSRPDHSAAPLEPFRHQGLPRDLMRTVKRMLEAWAYVLVLGTVAGFSIAYKVWWPLYPTVAIIALLLWFRKD